jgi:hypothetical protein
MNDTQVIRKYEKAGGWIGAIALGLVFFIISWFAPIDDVPGYKLITPEDFSILFGFAFAALVGGVVGYVGGAALGRRYGRQKTGTTYQRTSPSKPTGVMPRPVPITPVRVTPQPTPAATNEHPLLDLLLSHMPMDTFEKVRTAFAPVCSNFEFFTWVPLAHTQSIANEANRRGFTVWGNTDATSSILYGAGTIREGQLTEVMLWLREITVPGENVKGSALISQPGTQPRLIEFDSSKN